MAGSTRIRDAFRRHLAIFAKRPTAALSRGTATARSLGGYRCEVRDGDWRFEVDQPTGFGGEGTAPDPGVYGRTAVAACLVQSYLMWFAELEVPLEDIEVEVTGSGDLRGMFGIDDGVASGYGEMTCLVRIRSRAPEAEIEQALGTAEAHSPWLRNMTDKVPFRRRTEIQR